MGTFFKEKHEKSKILFIYRYLSLVLTSTFYFLNQSEHILSRKIFIISCLTIASIILSYLYLVFEDSKQVIITLLIIEIISNSILLIPSGGIKSPFIWYTLNTLLISSLFLQKIYLWLNVFLQIFITGIIAYYRGDFNFDILEFTREQSNLILSILMIIASIQILSIFLGQMQDKSRKLEEMNQELKLANNIIIESINHIKALYQSINILSNKGNIDGLVNIMFNNIEYITKTNNIFFYNTSGKEHRIISRGNQYFINLIEEKISNNIKEILNSKSLNEISISNTQFVMMNVGNNPPYYGILGFEITDEGKESFYKNNYHQIQFLSDLIAIALEKIDSEELNDRLIVSEEQNRIANEIHDGVLQRLFSMSCGVFSLIRRIPNYSIEETIEELNQFRETTDIVMKELRNKVYGLSWKQSGESSFLMDIKKYIEDIKRFCNINIPFTIMGNIELLPQNHKKAIYRIICEGIGNAARHGKSKNVEVNLSINTEFINLIIKDDGVGFDITFKESDSTMGLGIMNMNQLAESLHGSIEIESSLGIGTTIELALPLSTMVLREGESII